MKIIVRNDAIVIEGYVNAIERKSKPLHSRMGKFIERICKGAFKRAIERNEDIRILLNHDWNHNLGGTKDGSLELTEDAIGLKARATITDHEVIEKAKQGDLVGWSFGFADRDVYNHEEDGIQIRDVKDLDLYEVSILDRTKTPAYDGTLLAVRSDDTVQYHGENLIADVETVAEVEIRTDDPQEQNQEPQVKEPVSNIDYSQYEAMIAEMKGEKHND